MSKRRTKIAKRLRSLIAPLALKVISNRIFLIFLSLCALGFVVGRHGFHSPPPIPYEDLFDNIDVYSYREAPADSVTHVVVELNAGGHPFREYDIDTRRFSVPKQGSRYVRAVGGTRYRPLRLRGHAGQGFWLELPDSLNPGAGEGQFEQLYQRTLFFVRPLVVARIALGILSGYSVGYHLATWEGSLGNPAMQARIMDTPGIGRAIAREAWRRVLLEPVLMGDGTDIEVFGATHDKQRVYTNFFKLALRDSDDFVPREVARLAAAGQLEFSRAMAAFAGAVDHAQEDNRELSSDDFRAIEVWARMLYGRGHWARHVAPAASEERSMYLGALTYYGLAPVTPDQARIWIGPRVLVQYGEVDGFVADDIPATALGCPLSWRRRLIPDTTATGADAWALRWVDQSTMGIAQLMPVWKALRRGLPFLHPRPRI